MRLKDCESCLVYGSDRKPLSRARVTEVKENVLQLYFRSPKLKAVRLKTIVDFYDAQQGLIRTLCDMTLKKNPKVYEAGEPWMADCTLVKVYESFQRQKDIRVKVQIASEFVMSDGKYFSGTVRNISAGGLYMVTDQKMNSGQMFSFTYPFKAEPFRVNVRVLRVQELMGGYGYGCKFEELSPGEEADVRNFVYQKQIQRQLLLQLLGDP